MKVAVELATGYINLVPSAKGFGAAADREINPDAVGRKLGTDIGDAMQTAIQQRARDPISGRFVSAARAGGEQAGDQAGRAMADGISAKLAKVDLRKDTGAGLGGLSTLGAHLTGLLGGIGVAELGKQFFDAASDMNESVSKVGVVFGESAGQIIDWSGTTTKALGISKQDALEAAGTFGNLFRAMDIGTDQSADMSKSIVNLAGDLASFNNADPKDVLLALRSGLVGETEPLRQFGVNLNEARIKAEALRSGLVRGNVDMVAVEAKTRAVEKAQADENAALKQYGAQSAQYRDAQIKTAQAQQALEKSLAGSNIELTASQKAQAAYSLILQDTTLAQGDAGRTIDQTAGRTRVAAAAWEDLKAKLGAALLPAGTAVLGGIVTALDGISGWWDLHGPTVMAGLGQLNTWFHDIFGEDAVGNFTRGADIVIGKFHEIFGEDAVANLHRGADEIAGFWTTNFGADSDFQHGADTVAAKMNDVFGQDKVANFQLGADIIAAKMDEVFGPDKIGNLQRGMETLGSALNSIFVENFGGHFLDPIIGTIQALIDKLRELWDSDVVKFMREHLGLDALVGVLPKLLGFDQGGVVPGPRGSAQLAMVHGGETVLPTHRTISFQVDTSAASLPGAGGGASVPHIQTGDIHLHGVTDTDAALQVRHELHKLSLLSGRR
jgi:hypothetical protein